MIVVYNKDTKQFVGVATRVFDNGRWREPTLEELYPNADRTKLGYLYVEDSPKYALRPDSWQFKVDENGVPVGIERKPTPPRIDLTTDTPDTDDDGLPELVADGKSKATIMAELKDATGKLFEQDLMLTFRTTGGTLSTRKVMTKGGKVTLELTSSVETISVTVSASAEGVNDGSLSFEFMPPEEGS
jgi:hypothetical protein